MELDEDRPENMLTIESAAAIAPQQMARYRATAQQRAIERQQMLETRRQAAWGVARRAAALLKVDYGVSRVVLFGSLSRDEPFTPHSDIDLAVWGLDERVYYRVVSRLLDLDLSVSIDLLRAETLSDDLIHAIQTTGISL
jgi:predicted nucleotidyltransferase